MKLQVAWSYLATLIGFLFVVIIFLAWGLDKGLGVIDESYNLSYYIHADTPFQP